MYSGSRARVEFLPASGKNGNLLIGGARELKGKSEIAIRKEIGKEKVEGLVLGR